MVNRNDISFSIILATYNRKELVVNAINSVLFQSYDNYELIIVDDGSNDGTKEFITERYNRELENGKIKLIIKEKNSGLSNTRNIGLKEATNDWICYIDSDNMWKVDFLEVFKNAIINNINCKLFFCQFAYMDGRVGLSKVFDYELLGDGNYIDIGVVVHSRSLYVENGGFDPEVKRLSDWDLLLRYTKNIVPIFIDKILLMYDGSERKDRLSNNENYNNAFDYIQKKNCLDKYITRIEKQLIFFRESTNTLSIGKQELERRYQQLSLENQNLIDGNNQLQSNNHKLLLDNQNLDKNYNDILKMKNELENSLTKATKNVICVVIRKIQ